jgi:hypothetical protein
VSYKIQFTAVTAEATGAVAIWFCNDSPIEGDTCTAPSGMDLSGVTPTGGVVDTTVTGNPAANFVGLKTVNVAAGPNTITLAGVTNPDGTDLTNGTFYARIQTYASAGDMETDYTSGPDATVTTSVVDQGGIALALANEIGISAAVRETMTFCVYGAGSVDTAPHGSCDDTAAGTANSSGSSVPASLTLGEGSPQALSTSAVSTGKDYAQISTNAAHGAVVYMKNSNSCGGLKLFGASGCDISPATGGGSDFAAGNALFGVKLGSAASATGGNPSGAISSNAGYAHYNMLTSGTATDSSGTSLTEDVTSTYGGYLFGTSEAPIADKNIPLTFGASISNTTPAGKYSATIDLIAVGTY